MSARHTRGAVLALAATLLTLATACANPTAPAAASQTSVRHDGVTIGSSGDGVTIGSSGKAAATTNGVTIGSSG